MDAILCAQTGDPDIPCRVDPTPQELAQERRRATEAITGPLREQIFALEQQLQERDAMLCGVLTTLEQFYTFDVVSDNWDAQEAGVTWEQVGVWWQAHLEKDRLRREQAALEREALRRKVLSKLSKEEREILGL